MQTIEIHHRKPRIGQERWWNVLRADGNHEPLMTSEMLNSPEAAEENAQLVRDGRADVIIKWADQ